MTNISEHSITELSGAFRSGELSPTDAVEAALTNIDKHESKLGAFEIVLADQAREAADAATRSIASSHRIGPFHGIPFALKDLVDVKGLVTTGGTDVMSDNVATASATIAKRLISAGGILIGKTKTVEVAYGAWGTNQVRGTPWNPWDADVHRMPGGSSSGSGVALAGRMATCAVGTDTGGSVRIPAAACGLTGLKVTEGRLPLEGIVPLSHTLDTPGPMARSVADAIIMFEVLDGRHPADTEADMETTSGLFAAAAAGVAGLTLGALTDAEREGIDADILENYDAALERLRKLGAMIIPFELPVPIEDMKRDVGVLISADGYYHHGEMYETPSNRVDNDVKPRILYGKEVTSKRYIQALQRRQMHKQQTLAHMKNRIAAIVTPTLPTAPPPIAEVDQANTPAVLTRAVNYLGFCAMAQPMGLNSAGLPTSFQTIAPGNQEAMAIRIAAALERDIGPLGPPPMIS
jgi:aspartyl-tRNA(Asn)/glutamyl-tRNA(Gln) amidotransferase subunit A